MTSSLPFPSPAILGSEDNSPPKHTNISSVPAPMHREHIGPRHPSLNPNDADVLLQDVYWTMPQHGSPGPSCFPINRAQIPRIHVIQPPPPTTSWIRDFEGQPFYARRARLDEIDSTGAPVNAEFAPSHGTLSTSVTPPPAPVPRKRDLVPENQSQRFLKTADTSNRPPSFHPSQLQTMTSSGIMYPHEPNLQEANHKLSEHMKKSTTDPPSSSMSWRRAPLSAQSDNPFPTSPLTYTTAGTRLARREHPLQKSFTSDFESLLGEKPHLAQPKFDPGAAKRILADILTDPRNGDPDNTTRQTCDLNDGENNTRLAYPTPFPMPRVPPAAHNMQSSSRYCDNEQTITAEMFPSVPLAPGHIQVFEPGSDSFVPDHFISSSTPPPRSRQQLRDFPNPWSSSSRPTKTDVPPIDVVQAPPDNPHTELEILIVITQSIEATLEGMDDIRTFFMRVGHLYDVLPHTNTCLRVTSSLSALSTALQRRKRLDGDHMRLATRGWHAKYKERLDSTQRTLLKLYKMARDLKGRHSTRSDTINKVLGKLSEYDSKLKELTSKFNHLFDRLRIRHLHSLLTKEHATAVLQKRKVWSTEDVKIWSESKVRRALLRREFESYRAGRRTSLIS